MGDDGGRNLHPIWRAAMLTNEFAIARQA